MENLEYKPGAKCKRHTECTFYNLNALPLEVEVKMCNRNQPVDEKYIPFVPLIGEFKPAVEEPDLGPEEDPCCAFQHYENLDFISEIRKHISSMKDLFYKQGYW